MIFKKLIWTLKRHPFLYTTRFKLLSKNSSIEAIENISYNDTNGKEEIPSFFYEINNNIFQKYKQESELDRVIQLSSWLVDNIKGGKGLSVPSENALKMMLSGEGGVCSDMAQIFNNFCVINDIKVREWGSTRAPFDESYGGHSFNEVYIKELNQWVAIDVSYSTLFYDGQQNLLSVIQMYQTLRNGGNIQCNSFNDNVELNSSGIEKNYLNLDSVPFLICNYSNKVYDNYLNAFRPYLPVFLIHFIIYFFGKSYYYYYPLDDFKKIFS